MTPKTSRTSTELKENRHLPALRQHRGVPKAAATVVAEIVIDVAAVAAAGDAVRVEATVAAIMVADTMADGTKNLVASTQKSKGRSDAALL